MSADGIYQRLSDWWKESFDILLFSVRARLWNVISKDALLLK